MSNRTATVAVQVRDLTLRIQAQTLFADFNFDLPAQQFTCLLGSSGVGKSTLLKAIADILPRQDINFSGSIQCDNGEPLKQQIAYMAQTDSLLPWLSCLDNTLLYARLNGKVSQAQRQQAKALLAQLGMADALNKRPEALSGGMRQRVALARTLMQDKPIVLMDEPFSALDAITRLKLQDIAAELLRDKTVLLVTHDPLEALRLGDQVYVLAGQPAQVGEAIVPAGISPRDTTDSAILQLQGELLKQLEQQ